MNDESQGTPRLAPPASVEEAMSRARRHSRAALSEALAAAQALLDAASLGLRGEPAESHRALGALSHALEQASRQLADDAGRLSGPVVAAILDALDAEIARWEGRSADDAEARAVLRAFLGLREILWEFGMRREEPPSPGPKPSGKPSGKPGGKPGGNRGRGAAERPSRSGRRVQRIRVQG